MTMEARLLNVVAWPRLYAFFVGSLAGLVLVLAAAGVYGLLRYTVARREREIGIRMALGAGGTEIVALVLGQGAAIVGTGTLMGIGAAAAGSRMLESHLYGVTAADPLTFVLAPLVPVAVASVACWFPARRATRVDSAAIAPSRIAIRMSAIPEANHVLPAFRLPSRRTPPALQGLYERRFNAFVADEASGVDQVGGGHR